MRGRPRGFTPARAWGRVPLPDWALDLPNRGLLYERLVLDNLPRGVRAVARGARGAPFDLLVRDAASGEVVAWEVKGNELDERGALPERRRFSTSLRQVRWVEENRARVRLCFLWLDAPRGRFGFTTLAAERVRWKSPSSPKWVLPLDAPIRVRKELSRYAPPEEGARLATRWSRLPEADALPALSGAPARAAGSGTRGARTRATATPSPRAASARAP